jgi:hypothetical protein
MTSDELGCAGAARPRRLIRVTSFIPFLHTLSSLP